MGKPLSFVVLLVIRVYSSKLPDRCDDSSAVDNSQTGSTLLQSKRSEVRVLQRHDPPDELSVSTIGKTATFDEDGYQAVASTCCVLDMETYVRRLIDYKELELCNEYGLIGFVPWYTCDAEQSGTEVQSFAKLLHGIGSSQPPAPCAFVAPFGMCPSDYGNCGGEPSPETHRRRSCTSQSTLSPHGARRRRISAPSPSSSTGASPSTPYTSPATYQAPGTAMQPPSPDTLPVPAPSIVPVVPVPSPPLQVPTSPAAPVPSPAFPPPSPTAPAVAPPGAPGPPTSPLATLAPPTPAPPALAPPTPAQGTPAAPTPAQPTPAQPTPAPPIPAVPATVPSSPTSPPAVAPPTPASIPLPATTSPPTPPSPTPSPPTPQGSGWHSWTVTWSTTTTTTKFLFCRICGRTGWNTATYQPASAATSDQSVCWATYESDDSNAPCDWTMVEGIGDVLHGGNLFPASNTNRVCKASPDYENQGSDDNTMRSAEQCAGYCQADPNCRFFSMRITGYFNYACYLCDHDATQNTWQMAGVNDLGNSHWTLTYEKGRNCAHASLRQSRFCTQEIVYMEGTDLAAGSYSQEASSNRVCTATPQVENVALASDCISTCYQTTWCNYVSIRSANTPYAQRPYAATPVPTDCYLCQTLEGKGTTLNWVSPGSYDIGGFSGQYLTGTYKRETSCSTSPSASTSSGSSTSGSSTSGADGSTSGTVTTGGSGSSSTSGSSTSGAGGSTSGTVTTGGSGSSSTSGTSTSGAGGSTSGTVTTGGSSSSSTSGTSTSGAGGSTSGTVTSSTGGTDSWTVPTVAPGDATSGGSTGASVLTSGSWVNVNGNALCSSSGQSTGTGGSQGQEDGSGMYCFPDLGIGQGERYTMNECAQLCSQNEECVRFSYGHK